MAPAAILYSPASDSDQQSTAVGDILIPLDHYTLHSKVTLKIEVIWFDQITGDLVDVISGEIIDDVEMIPILHKFHNIVKNEAIDIYNKDGDIKSIIVSIMAAGYDTHNNRLMLNLVFSESLTSEEIQDILDYFAGKINDWDNLSIGNNIINFDPSTMEVYQ